jgi:hypothetical protein
MSNASSRFVDTRFGMNLSAPGSLTSYLLKLPGGLANRGRVGVFNGLPNVEFVLAAPEGGGEDARC